MKTSVVYVSSPDREISVFASIQSLIYSGTSFDKIKVYSVGGEMINLRKLDIPIEVKEVKNKFQDDFYANKTYIENVNSERVIYLDADTVVLGNIDNIYENKKSKVFARKVHDYDENSFDVKSWKKVLKRYSAKEGAYFNSGFVIFQGFSHKCIGNLWKEIYKSVSKKYDNLIKKVSTKKTLEQISLSISIMKKKINVEEMKKKYHRYGWRKKPNEIEEDAIVYHTGSRGGRHLKYASAVASGRDLSFNIPLISSVKHPLFLKLQGYDLAYRAKHFFTGVGN